jgi:hypothetical protein
LLYRSLFSPGVTHGLSLGKLLKDLVSRTEPAQNAM